MRGFFISQSDSQMRKPLTKIISLFLAVSLVFAPVASYAQAINILNLPAPGTMVAPSASFAPVLLKGMTIDPADPLRFDFIVDSGDTGYTADEVRSESEKLVKYFLASMTIPKDDLWVNLSPYENERIIPQELGNTELGRDMLAQDYLLKQLTASLIYPENELGERFWNKVYQRAEEEFGTSEIPVNTFNKVWILPESATVYEHQQTVYVVSSRLKVMLDSDYEAMQYGNAEVAATDNALEVSQSIIREIVIPEIEKEVNQGAHFAPLRQIYNSLILAKWYKETVKDGLLSQVYADKNMIDGVDIADPTVKDEIYSQYMAAYEKGVFNYIKEDYDRLSRTVIPRKYFSGGEALTNVPLRRTFNPESVQEVQQDLQHDRQIKKFVLGYKFDPLIDGSSADLGTSSSPVNLDDPLLFPANVSTYADAHEVDLGNMSRTDVTYAYPVLSDDLIGLDQRTQEGIEFVRVYKVPELPNGLQYAYDRSKGELYLAEGFQDHTGFDLVTGMRIFLAAADEVPLNGIKKDTAGYDIWEKQDLVAMAKGWAAVNRWAEKRFPVKVRQRFPDGKTVAELKKSFEDALWAGMSEAEMTEFAESAFGLEGIDFDNLKGARNAQTEAKERVSAMWELIGMNALYAGIDFSKQHPRFDKIKDISEYFSAGQLSAKFNPITLAHLGVTVLSTFALSGVSDFRVNVSVYDPRKPDIEKTYPERLLLARADIEELFSGLVTIYLEKEGLDELDELKEWNGEEVFAKTVKKIAEKARFEGRTGPGSAGKQVYTAGGDHFFIFAPDRGVSGLIGFMDVRDPKIRKYQTFYVDQLSDASVLLLQELVTAQVEGEFRGLTFTPERIFSTMDAEKKDGVQYDYEMRTQVINAITTAEGADQVRDIYRAADILPSLDVAMKLMLIQEAYPEVEIIFAHTNRKDDMGADSLRDVLIDNNHIKVMNVKGFDQPFSATKLRTGLTKIVYTKFDGQGIFFPGFLYGASEHLLEVLLSDPALIETLLFQAGLELPYVFNGMWNRDELIEKQEEIRAGRDIRVTGESTFDVDSKDKYTSARPVVSLHNSSGEQVASITYSVFGNFSENGERQYTVNIHEKSGEESDVKELIAYVDELNENLLSDPPFKFNKASSPVETYTERLINELQDAEDMNTKVRLIAQIMSASLDGEQSKAIETFNALLQTESDPRVIENLEDALDVVNSSQSSPVMNNLETDTRLADSQSAQTPDELHAMLTGDVLSIKSPRDMFVYTELALRGDLRFVLAREEIRNKLPADFDLSEASGESIIRWLYSRSVIQYVDGSEVSMSSSPVEEEVGGIDLNNIEVEASGSGITVEFDPVQVQTIIDAGVTGFAPVIINVTPLPSVMPLLGLSPRREEDQELLEV